MSSATELNDLTISFIMFLLSIFFLVIILPLLAWRATAWFVRAYCKGTHPAWQWLAPLLASIVVLCLSVFLIGWSMFSGPFMDIGLGCIDAGKATYMYHHLQNQA